MAYNVGPDFTRVAADTPRECEHCGSVMVPVWNGADGGWECPDCGEELPDYVEPIDDPNYVGSRHHY